jgi:hypothetical protein
MVHPTALQLWEPDASEFVKWAKVQLGRVAPLGVKRHGFPKERYFRIQNNSARTEVYN